MATDTVDEISTNLSKNLSFTVSKNQFKWNGEYEDLKKFILSNIKEDQAVIIAENDNGSCKVLKLEGLTFNFYERTKTLQIQGVSKVEYVEKFKKIIEQELDETHVVGDSKDQDVQTHDEDSHDELSEDSQDELSEDSEDDDNDELRKAQCHCRCDLIEKRFSSLEKTVRLLESKLDIPTSTDQKDNEIYELRSQVFSLTTELGRAKIEIAAFQPILQAKDQADLEIHDLHSKLRTVTKELEEAKMELAESSKSTKIKDREISDLSLKVNLLGQELDQTKSERDGFATTIRVLQQFQGTPPNIATPYNPSYSRIQDNQDREFIDDANIGHNNNNNSHPQRRRRNQNRTRRNLNIDNSSNNASNNSGPNNASNNRTNDGTNNGTNNPEPNNETFTTVIVGDSVVKNIQGYNIGKKTKSRVIVKSYSGATTADMHHHVIPTIQKKPDQIIIHVGTNDLQTLEPHQIAEKIVDLARNIERKSENDVKVAISLLTTRRGYQEQIKTVNKQLKRFAGQNGWRIMDNKNIMDEDLNLGGVHLERRKIYKASRRVTLLALSINWKLIEYDTF